MIGQIHGYAAIAPPHTLLPGVARNKCGHRVYSHGRGGDYSRRHVIPTNTISNAKTAAQNFQIVISTAWSDTLTNAERALWRLYATDRSHPTKLGDRIDLHGFCWFAHFNRARLQMQQSLLRTPPTSTATPEFAKSTAAEVTQLSGIITRIRNLVSGELDPTAPLYIFATLPMKAKLKPQRNQFRLLNIPTPSQPDLNSDLALLYNARWGNPTATTGYKVHFRITRISTGTGAISERLQIATTITPDQQLPEETMVGEIVNYAGTDTPAGYLECNGAPVSRTTYAALYAILGIAYGPGNGTTTFNVPDFRGRVPVGAGTGIGGGASGSGLPTGGTALTARTRGDWTGKETHTLAALESGIASHSHANTAAGAATGAGSAHTHGRSYYVGSGNEQAPNYMGGNLSHSTATSTAGPNIAENAHTHPAGAITITNANAGPTAAANSHETMQPVMCIRFLIKS